MRIAVFALQGAFIEHRQMLHRLGADSFEVRQLSDWQQPKDGVILPGGESTVQLRLLRELQLFEPLRQDILNGLPVLGTCAGMILLSEGRLATMDMRVRRNAYGRQLGSFHAYGTVTNVNLNDNLNENDRSALPLGSSKNVNLNENRVLKEVPMTFIRAPFIEEVLSDRCQVMARVDGNIVAARQNRQIATAFHPELDEDTRLHELFLSLCRK